MGRPKKSNRADGRYQICRVVGHTINGKPIRKYFYGKDSEDAQNKYFAYINGDKKNGKDILFEEWMWKWLEDYKRDQVKTNTYLSTYVRPCKNQILPFFKNYLIQDIKPIDIQKFFNTNKSLSQSTLQKCDLCLNSIFETAIDNGYIDRNPCRNIKRASCYEKKPKRVYDAETIEYIYNNGGDYAIYFLILSKMGFRCSELCGLRWENIDLENNQIHIVESLVSEGGLKFKSPTKSYSSKRTLPIEDDRIFKWLEENKMYGKAYIVKTPMSVEMTPNRFSRVILKKIYDHAEIPEEKRLSPHELRHTCGTLMYENTKDIYKVSKYLGHSDISITSKVYVHSEYQEKFTTINCKNMQ